MIQNMVGADVKIFPNGDPSVTDERIRDAVAKRAFQIFESRGCRVGHERQDWILAESQVIKPLCCGVLETEHAVDLAVDLAGFDLRCGIEIVAEPHRLILGGFGRDPNERGKARPKKGLSPEIFGTVHVPTAVDATKVEANLRGHVLQIRVAKAIQLVPTYCEHADT